MPNLVGIGNSQVPTNAMLGGLAYQDSVGEIDIDKIKARTADTARDIFVYDTQKILMVVHGEIGQLIPLGTMKVQVRQEVLEKNFPLVAIIVVEQYQVTIYDADDPNFQCGWCLISVN